MHPRYIAITEMADVDAVDAVDHVVAGRLEHIRTSVKLQPSMTLHPRVTTRRRVHD